MNIFKFRRMMLLSGRKMQGRPGEKEKCFVVKPRKAGEADIAILTAHHDAMFRELFELDGRPVEAAAFAAMGNGYREKLFRQLAEGTFVAWIIDAGTGVAASAAVTFLEAVPVPMDPNYRIAFLHSVYTEPLYRRNGYAETLLVEAMRYCAEEGIRRIDLVASDAGRPLYEKLGFKLSSSSMRYLSPAETYG